jgi:hypothetical protein
MSDQLEQFINDHREEFDADEPSKRIWDNIQKKLEPETRQEARVVRFNPVRWSAAASVVLLLGAGAWYFLSNRITKVEVPANQVARINPVKKETPKPSIDSVKAGITKDSQTQSPQIAKQHPVSPKSDPGMDNDIKNEMVYYAKIVEIKHDELKKIQKDEPLLYKQFSGDVYKLDSVYQSLKKQLPKNPNREQLLEAMIQNLQLQMELLNRQLHIIKQINNSKKSAYEEAYKSA